MVIPKGFPKSVGRVESLLLGFPCFPYSVISMACFGNACRKTAIRSASMAMENQLVVETCTGGSLTTGWRQFLGNGSVSCASS